MPHFNENNPYNPLFEKPEDPLSSEQAADIEELKNDIKKAEDLLKNGKLSPEARLQLKATVAICTMQLERVQIRSPNAAVQL